MDAKTIVAVVLVAFIIGGFIFLQIKNRKKDMVFGEGGSNQIPLPTGQGTQEVFCIRNDFIPLWLAKISITQKTKEERPEFGQLVNEVRNAVEVEIESKRELLEEEALNEQLENETIDVSKSTIDVYNAIVSSPNDTRVNLIVKLNISESTVNRAILELKQRGIIERQGGKRYGYWKILKSI